MKKILALLLVITLSLTFLVGCEGDTGPKGAAGVSVVGASVDGGYLILTLSDGSTITAGYVKGAKGDTGITGLTGVQGTAGTAGSVWYAGIFPPIYTLGVTGDFYLDSLTGNIYQKTAVTTWSYICSIKGPIGPQGIQGLTGATGRGATGATGAPGNRGARYSGYSRHTGYPGRTRTGGGFPLLNPNGHMCSTKPMASKPGNSIPF